jgi:hypothetical protein
MVCKITLEKRGPIATNSSNLHISPNILVQIYQTIWLSHILQSAETIHLSRISLRRRRICWLCMTHTDCTLCLKFVRKSDLSVNLGKCGRPTDNELTMLTMVCKILLLVPLSWKTYITQYHTGYSLGQHTFQYHPRWWYLKETCKHLQKPVIHTQF